MKKTGGIFGLFGKKNIKSENLEDDVDQITIPDEQPISDLNIIEDEIALEIEEEPFDGSVECSGANLEKLINASIEASSNKSSYRANLVFEDINNQFTLVDSKDDEKKRISNWLNTICGSHLNAYMLVKLKHKAILKSAEDKATRENIPMEHVPEPSIDGKVYLHVSADYLVAWLFVLPPFGEGIDITMEDIELLLKENNISLNVNHDYIQGMIERFAYYHLYPIAIGTSPIMGDNGYIDDYYPREKKVFTPNTDGIIDYRATDYFMPVFKDDPICEIIQPTEGTPGTDVRGNIVQPKPGEKPKIPNGINTRVSEDGVYLIATVDGDVMFDKDVFNVRNAFRVEGDVDYSTGNINFMGNVHIKGNVRDKFIVRATGNVVVDGVLEAGIIDADGDVILSGGVLGNDEGTIRSRGNVRAKFMESCKVYAAGSITTDYIIRCDVHCDEALTVTSGKGTIIGGNISIHKYVEAKSIGKPNGALRSTILNMGVDPCLGGDEVSTIDFFQAFEEAGLGDELQELHLEREQNRDLDIINSIMADTAIEVEMTDEEIFTAENCRAKFITINTGVLVKYTPLALDIQNNLSGTIRYSRKENKIIIS